MRRLAVLLAALVVAVPAAAQGLRAERWTTYRNARFGTIVDYPADLFARRRPPPANGDGRSFETADGRAEFAVFGGFNALEHTPASYVDDILADLVPHATYRRVTGDWFVLAGTRDGTVFYRRCNFTRDRRVLHCLVMGYPAAETAAWDAVVTRMSRSLRFERGQDF